MYDGQYTHCDIMFGKCHAHFVRLNSNKMHSKLTCIKTLQYTALKSQIKQ